MIIFISPVILSRSPVFHDTFWTNKFISHLLIIVYFIFAIVSISLHSDDSLEWWQLEIIRYWWEVDISNVETWEVFFPHLLWSLLVLCLVTIVCVFFLPMVFVLLCHMSSICFHFFWYFKFRICPNKAPSSITSSDMDDSGMGYFACFTNWMSDVLASLRLT